MILSLADLLVSAANRDKEEEPPSSKMRGYIFHREKRSVQQPVKTRRAQKGKKQ